VAAGEALQANLQARKALDDRRFSFVLEVLSQIHLVKSQALEEPMLRRQERLAAAGAEASWKANYFGAQSENLAASFSAFSLLAMGGAGAWLVVDGHMSVGALAACTLISGRMTAPLLRVLGLFTRYRATRVHRSRLEDAESFAQERIGAGQPAAPIETLSLRDVWHRPGPDRDPLFKGLDFTLRHGETVGLSGANGAGKSTLLDLLIGLQTPERGEAFANGTPLASLDLGALRRQVAYIPQRATLFRGSILDNLTRFDPDAHLDEALALAAQLGLDRYFAALPEGYDLAVGDGAVVLPPGVAQRVAMVRALVGAPRVILFDDANTALDEQGDRLVREVLASYRGRTAMLLVSYRPSLLALADRRLLLRDGAVQALDPLEARARA